MHASTSPLRQYGLKALAAAISLLIAMQLAGCGDSVGTSAESAPLASGTDSSADPAVKSDGTPVAAVIGPTDAGATTGVDTDTGIAPDSGIGMGIGAGAGTGTGTGTGAATPPSGAAGPAKDHPFVAGVTAHMAWNISTTVVGAKLADLGTRSVRDEAYWAAYERKKGVYDIRGLSASIQEAMTGKFDVSNSVLVLDYGNPLYRNGSRPITDDVIEGFVNYAVNVIKDGGWRWGFIQVWNEWNLPMRENGETVDGNAADYARLFKAVAQAIRPLGNFKILTQGSIDRFNGYLHQKELVAHGVLQYADGFGHHSYNWGHRELATPDRLITRLHEIQAFLTAANGGKPFPIYITEFGWPGYNNAGFTEQQIGPYISQFMKQAKGLGWVKGVWLYNLFDKGTDLNNPESGFGIYGPGGQEKMRTQYIREAMRAANS